MACNKLITLFILNYFAFPPSLGARECPFDVVGLIASGFTPMDSNGNLALDVIPDYAQYLTDNEIKGVRIGGNIGEGPKLSLEEMKSLISAWISAIGSLDLKTIVVVGGRPFPDAIELAKFAEQEGADAISNLADLFYKPTSARELLFATEKIAEAAPLTPLIYYADPAITGDDVDLLEFAVLATQRIPSFKGVSIDACDDARVKDFLVGDQVTYIANATYFTPSVYLGYNAFIFPEIDLFPDLTKEILDKGQQGLLNETNSLNLRLSALSSIIVSEGDQVPAYKAAMAMLTGIDVGPPREPESALSEDKLIDLKQRLKNEGIEIIIPADNIDQ